MALSSILGVWLHEESLGGVGEGGGEVGSGGKENRLVVFSQDGEDTGHYRAEWSTRYPRSGLRSYC